MIWKRVMLKVLWTIYSQVNAAEPGTIDEIMDDTTKHSGRYDFFDTVRIFILQGGELVVNVRIEIYF